MRLIQQITTWFQDTHNTKTNDDHQTLITVKREGYREERYYKNFKTVMPLML